jgi:hypothetical protein
MKLQVTLTDGTVTKAYEAPIVLYTLAMPANCTLTAATAPRSGRTRFTGRRPSPQGLWATVEIVEQLTRPQRRLAVDGRLPSTL